MWLFFKKSNFRGVITTELNINLSCQNFKKYWNLIYEALNLKFFWITQNLLFLESSKKIIKFVD